MAEQPISRVTPSRFIARLRDADPDFMINLFTRGGCYQLFLILSAVYPNAEPWVAELEGHAYTRIGDRWYDILGPHRKLDDLTARRMTKADQRKAATWLAERIRKHAGEMCRCVMG